GVSQTYLYIAAPTPSWTATPRRTATASSANTSPGGMPCGPGRWPRGGWNWPWRSRRTSRSSWGCTPRSPPSRVPARRSKVTTSFQRSARKTVRRYEDWLSHGSARSTLRRVRPGRTLPTDRHYLHPDQVLRDVGMVPDSCQTRLLWEQWLKPLLLRS